MIRSLPRLLTNTSKNNDGLSPLVDENRLNPEIREALKDKKVGLVRADSGFYSQEFLEWFEKRGINYIVAVKFYENIKLKHWTLK